MSRTKRVFKNSAILTLQHIILNVISIFVIAYIARKLGHQDYGIYSLAFCFPSLFEVIGNLGFRTLTVREVSRTRENSFEYLGKMIPSRIIFIGIMGITVVLAAYLMNYEKRVIVSILIALGSSLFDQLSRIILDVFQAFEEMGKVAIRDVIIRLVTAFSCVAVLLSGYGLYEICFAYMIGSLLGLVINVFLFLRRFPIPDLKIDFNFIVRNLKEGSSFVIIVFASVILVKADVVMLSKLTDNPTVGLYNASASLFYRLNLLSDNVSMAVLPAIAELYWVNINEANSILNKALLVVLIIALPVAIGGFILSDQLIILLYGKSYYDSVLIFKIIIITIPFMYLVTLFYYVLGAIHQQKYVAIVLVIGVAMNICANYVMINWLGAKGAAIATLITQALCFTLLFCAIVKHFTIHINVRSLSVITLSLSSLACVAYFLKPLGIYVAFTGATLTYFIALVILGRKEIDVFKLLKIRQYIRI